MAKGGGEDEENECSAAGGALESREDPLRSGRPELYGSDHRCATAVHEAAQEGRWEGCEVTAGSFSSAAPTVHSEARGGGSPTRSAAGRCGNLGARQTRRRAGPSG